MLGDSVPAIASIGYLLAKSFGWTPEDIRKLTMAEALIYCELLEKDKQNG